MIDRWKAIWSWFNSWVNIESDDYEPIIYFGFLVLSFNVDLAGNIAEKGAFKHCMNCIWVEIVKKLKIIIRLNGLWKNKPKYKYLSNFQFFSCPINIVL